MKKITFHLFALLSFLFVTQMALAQGSIIRGTVYDESGEPVQGATVVIPKQGTGAYTNDQGIFSISKLPAGKHEVRITFIGYDTIRATVEVGTNATVTQGFRMKETSIEVGVVEITDNANGKIEKARITVGLEEITPQEIKVIPSFGGTPDLAQYMQVVPGVVFTGDQGGQLYVRGGTPIQNMVLLDGAVIYSPFHSIGLFSVFDTDYLRGVDVYTAAFPAEYGGRISSIMDIRTRNGDYKNFHSKIDLNPVVAGTMIEGPLFKPKEGSNAGGSFLLSARRCYLDKTSPLFYSYVNDTNGLPFNFTDLFGKLSFSDGSNNFSLFGFYQSDNVNYTYPTTYRWHSAGGGARFMLLPANSNLILTGNLAFSGYNSGLSVVSEDFPRRSLINGFNGTFNFNYIINNVNEINYGISLLGFKTDYEFTNSFGLITSQVFNNTEAAGYFRYKKVFHGRDLSEEDSLTERLVLEPSLRIHYYNDHSYLSPEPRFRFKFNLPRVSVTGGVGMYSQNLVSATSDRDVVNLFQGFLAAPPNLSNPIKNHTLQTSVHYLTGVEIELLPGLSTTIEGWYKDFTQLTNINRDKLFPEDPDFIVETGSARGVDLIMEYADKHWFLYGTYGLMKVDRDDGKRIYPTVWDRRHTVNLVGAYKTGKLYRDDSKVKGKLKFSDPKWEFSTRFTLGSGFPFTQTLGFFEKIDFTDDGAQTDYTTQNGSLGILYSEQINGGRLPYYHRLDFSAKRRWVIKNAFMVEAVASVLNTYNRQNIFYFDRVRFAVVNQLPILPSLGITVKF
jgi:hypothetical protein